MVSYYTFYFEPNANIVSRRQHNEDCLKLRIKKAHERELDRCVTLVHSNYLV
jgi:hypothetical protein